MGYLQSNFQATHAENCRLILEAMPPWPGATLLDLGCGDGDWTQEVGEHIGADRLLGVELIEEFADRASDAGIEVSRTNLGERLPFETGSVDVVHSNQVIEHLPRTDGFMREIARVLAPGGYAVISTNNLSSWHNVAALVLGWQPSPCHVSDEAILGSPMSPNNNSTSEVPLQTHLRVFTGKGLATLASYHGLEVEEQRSSGYYPLPPRVARAFTRLDPRHGAYLVQRYRNTRT